MTLLISIAIFAVMSEPAKGIAKPPPSIEEVVAAKPTAYYDAKWGGFVIDGNTFTALVYEGV